MPNCFSLTPKGHPDAEPESLKVIDEEIAAYLGVKCHPKLWTWSWYEFIGWWLAMGRTFEYIISECQKEVDKVNDSWEGHTHPMNQAEDHTFYVTLKLIAQWLDQNYHANAWAEIGRGK